MNPIWIAAIGLAFVLIAWGLWAAVRCWDRTNAILAAAPSLPIRLVNVHDDVWVRGEVECDHPVRVRHFQRPCVHYSYRLEEYVTRTRTTSDGKTETYSQWETRETDQGHARFRVYEDGHILEIEAKQASFQHEPTLSETLGSWRHSCSYTPVGIQVSAVGVVDEDKQSLIPYQHVPLIVTTKRRAKYLADAEAQERWGMRFGLVFLFIGFVLIAYGLLRYLQIRGEAFHPELLWDPITGIWAALIGFLATVMFWALRVFNSLVTFRIRADERWSTIDVQLKQRYDLIPPLVTVVQAYQKHEQALLERLTLIRSKAMTGSRTDRVWIETETIAGLARLFAVVEDYPDLKANEHFRRLMDELTVLEEKIAHARTVFNEAVTEYNEQTMRFPANLIARLCRFDRYPLFAASLEEQHLPQVQFQSVP